MWQNGHSNPLPQPSPFQTNAHGLHCPLAWFMEPTVGISGLPNCGPVDCGRSSKLASFNTAGPSGIANATGGDAGVVAVGGTCEDGALSSRPSTRLPGAERTILNSKKPSNESNLSAGKSKNVFRTTSSAGYNTPRSPESSPGEVLLL
eukprot:CAMPEP_0117505296 /NCGR_PEP_ID=MMETSP0784-20121206/25303_1 /TAXON_ID=39447 /ORGANISM="" /LENGTH=147 /DNA_ID=CAMNT_0005300701 /DNA_START=246 /DNA_END=689 /DNA_ORIENTATION=+